MVQQSNTNKAMDSIMPNDYPTETLTNNVTKRKPDEEGEVFIAVNDHGEAITGKDDPVASQRKQQSDGQRAVKAQKTMRDEHVVPLPTDELTTSSSPPQALYPPLKLEQWHARDIDTFRQNFEACVTAIRNAPKITSTRTSAADSELNGMSIEGLNSSTASDSLALAEITIDDLKACGGTVDTLRKAVFEETALPPGLDDLVMQPCDLNQVMCGYLLPSGISWPFFAASKQRFAKARNMLYSRLSGTHPALLQEALRLVNVDCRYAAIVGAPGIGKSADMNYMLLQFISHLGEEHWKSRVFVRIRNILAEVYLESSGVHYRYNKFLDLDSLSCFYYTCCTDTVLLLELGEKEVDPDVEIPTITSTSSRKADCVFKTMNKSKRLSFLLAEPHTAEEAVCEVLLANAASPGSFDLLTVLKKHRTDPRPRAYLGDKAIVHPGLNGIQYGFKNPLEFSALNIPEQATRVMAPYVAPGVIIPYAEGTSIPMHMFSQAHAPGFSGPRHVYRYFNDQYALKAGTFIETWHDLRAVRNVGVLWQIHECHVLYGGLLIDKEQDAKSSRRQRALAPEATSELEAAYVPSTVIDNIHSSENWQWFRDCGPNAALRVEDIVDEPTPSLRRCVDVVRHHRAILQQPAWGLLRDHVYASTAHNRWLYDFLFVTSKPFQTTTTMTANPELEGESKATVYMVQVTDRLVDDHPFELASVEKVLRGLSLLTLEATQHISKVVFVFVICNSREVSSTSGITVTTQDVETGETKYLSWNEAVRAVDLPQAIECEAYIVRAQLTTGSGAVVV